MGGETGYDVVVGRGVLAELGDALGPAVREGARRAPADARGPRGGAPRGARRAGSRCSSPRCPTPRRASASRSPPSAGRSSARPTSPAATPSSASAAGRSPTSPGSSPPPGCAACGVVQVPTTRARHGRRGRRRQDRHQHRTRARTSSARSTPRARCSATSTLLDTLPRNEILAGFAEIVKAGFIRYPEILDLIEADPDAATDPTSPRVPARRRARDPHEGRGRRRRTSPSRACARSSTTATPSATPIEHAERYQWRHGAAVSVGMVVRRRARPPRPGGSPTTSPTGTSACSTCSGCRRRYPAGRWNTLLATMQRDKKARGGQLRFIVLDDLAQAHGDAGARPVAAVRRVPGDRLLSASARRRAATTAAISGCRAARLAA